MKRFIMTVGLMAAVATPAFGGSVTSGTDTTEFNSGEAAVAAEVNGNFQALIDAINDNDARISALEGAIGDGSTDGTYTFLELAVELAADSGTTSVDAYSEITVSNATGSFSLDQGGTFTGTINSDRATLYDTINGDCNSGDCRNALDPDFNNSETENLSGTWTETASTVTLDLGGDTVVLNKAGPKLLVLSDSDSGGSEPVFSFKNIVLLIKQ